MNRKMFGKQSRLTSNCPWKNMIRVDVAVDWKRFIISALYIAKFARNFYWEKLSVVLMWNNSVCVECDRNSTDPMWCRVSVFVRKLLARRKTAWRYSCLIFRLRRSRFVSRPLPITIRLHRIIPQFGISIFAECRFNDKRTVRRASSTNDSHRISSRRSFTSSESETIKCSGRETNRGGFS